MIMVISKVFRFELDIHLINSSVLLAYHLLFSFCTHAHSGGRFPSYMRYVMLLEVLANASTVVTVMSCHVIFRNLGNRPFVRSHFFLESVLISASHVYMLNITFISGSVQQLMHMLS